MFPENRFLELMIIGAVALIVVGPKDLPILMRRVGQFVGKMRGMANEFRASFEDLAHQSELEDLRKEVEAMRADHRTFTQYNPMTASSSTPAYAPAEEALAAPVPPVPPTDPAPSPAPADPVPPKPTSVHEEPRVDKPDLGAS
jgi:sec-independent protein translocase protein TatB